MWGFDKLLEQDKASKKDVLEELLGGMPIPQRDGAEEKK